MLDQEADPAALLAGWRDGRIKQHVVARTLALRRADPELFCGGYTALETTGPHAERLVAFARTTEDAAMVVIGPRLATPLLDGAEIPLPPAQAWGDTRVILPEIAADRLHDQLSRATIDAGPAGVLVADVLATFPVALLTAS
jgi:(1->4)-alpha-D-glucan 1-alpha-D-glucosylmutase